MLRNSRKLLCKYFLAQIFSAFKVSILFYFRGSFLAGVTHLDALFVFHVIFDII